MKAGIAITVLLLLIYGAFLGWAFLHPDEVSRPISNNSLHEAIQQDIENTIRPECFR